jgi:lysophospholipase L1-like esterase
MSRRLTVLACLVTSFLLIPAVPAAAATSVQTYYALGDSFSAGVGAPGQSGLCLRSSRSYTSLWASANDPDTYRSLACSGAETGDVTSYQVPFLSRRADLITITIGGNDAGFADTVIACTLGTDASCATKVETARATITGALKASLDRTYAAIKRKAPDAEVIVLGYPRLFDESAASCGFAGMSQVKRRAINAGADTLSDVIEERAGAAGFTYVDVRDRFEGHGACGPSPWINGLTVIPPQNSFHPNASGYSQGYLPAMRGALN